MQLQRRSCFILWTPWWLWAIQFTGVTRVGDWLSSLSVCLVRLELNQPDSLWDCSLSGVSTVRPGVCWVILCESWLITKVLITDRGWEVSGWIFFFFSFNRIKLWTLFSTEQLLDNLLNYYKSQSLTMNTLSVLTNVTGLNKWNIIL